MQTSAVATPHRTRRWFRFRIRSPLAAITLAALAFGGYRSIWQPYIATQAAHRQAAEITRRVHQLEMALRGLPRTNAARRDTREAMARVRHHQLLLSREIAIWKAMRAETRSAGRHFN